MVILGIDYMVVNISNGVRCALNANGELAGFFGTKRIDGLVAGAGRKIDLRIGGDFGIFDDSFGGAGVDGGDFVNHVTVGIGSYI